MRSLGWDKLKKLLSTSHTWTGVQTLESPVLNTGVSGTAVSTDGTMAANSDTLINSQKSIRTYVASAISAITDPLIGTTGGFVRKFYEATADITADASVTITLNIPATSRILGCQLRVDAALTATELWDAAYSGGSSSAIASSQAVAQNTRVNSMTTDVTTDVTNIIITKNGGGSFTAQGTIRAIVYCDVFTAMGDV